MKKNITQIYILFVTIIFIFSCTKEEPLVVIGDILGTVTDVETNQVLQGVIAGLTPVNQSKETGSDGRYTFKDLEAGNYKISFERGGYKSNHKDITIIAGQASSGDISLTPIKPVLSITKSELNFGKDETTLSFAIINTGKGDLVWEIKESIDFLVVNPTAGITTTESSPVLITIDREDAEPGNYERTVSVTSNGGNVDLLIKAIIEGPILDVTPLNLDFGSKGDKKILLLTNNGIGSLDYTLSSEKTWISIIPNVGNLTTETDQIEITVNRSGLNYGNYAETINVISDVNTIVVDVQMIVQDPNMPQLSITPKTINFGNKGTSENLTITNHGREILEWGLTENVNWIDVDKNFGSLASNESVVLTVTIDRTGFAPNNYSDLIIVSSNGGSETCTIEMEILAEPILFVEPSTLNFGHDKEILPFTISNLGTGNLNWSLIKNKEWINIAEISGTNLSSINVTVDRSELEVGTHIGQLSINSNGGTGYVVINAEKRNPNTPPVVDFSVTPATGFLESNFVLDLTCSDDFTSVDSLELRWKWQSEDVFTTWSTTKSGSHTYSTAGTKNITVEVKDEDEKITALTKAVVVNKNNKPLASFTVTPTSGTINTEFIADANSSSDDFTSIDDLDVRWNWGDNQDFTAWTTTKIASHTYTSAGNWAITLEVKDDGGLTNSTTQNITILDREIEPNNTIELAQIINVNSTILGTIQGSWTNVGGDVDYYSFTPTENGDFYFSVKNLHAYTGFGGTVGRCALYKDGESGVITEISNIGSTKTKTSSTISVIGGIKYLLKVSPSGSDYVAYELTSVFQ